MSKSQAELIEEARRKVDAGEELTEEEVRLVWEALQPAFVAFRQIMESMAAAVGRIVTLVDWTALAKALEEGREPTRPLIHNGKKPR